MPKVLRTLQRVLWRRLLNINHINAKNVVNTLDGLVGLLNLLHLKLFLMNAKLEGDLVIYAELNYIKQTIHEGN